MEENVTHEAQTPYVLKVSGRIVGVPSLPAPPARLNLAPRGALSATMGVPPSTTVKNDLTYEFTGVPSGTYTVQLSAGAVTLKESLVLTVTDRDLVGIDLAVIDMSVTTRQEGLEKIWSLAGSWGAVVGNPRGGGILASGTRTQSEIDVSGNVLREISFPRGPVWRVARFSGIADSVLIAHGTWSPSVQAYDSTGKVLWAYPDAANPLAGVDDAWPIDLDGDQSDEVVIGFNGRSGLHVVDSKGKAIWTNTSIGNVWHVSAGDVRGNGKPQVVTTSASGKVHVFSDDGNGKVDLDAGVYANMVRVGKVNEKDTAATIFAGGTASDNSSAILVALTADGTKKWTVQLQAPGRPAIYSTYLATGKPWLAVGMGTGAVYVVDAERGAIIASIDGHGQSPEVAWMAGKDDADPILVVSARTSLTAFRVTGVRATR